MALASGSKLGRYEILSAIGAGGMGEVYRARDVELGRDVAVKILNESLAADSSRLQRFQQEARITASTNHPNIVTVYDVGIIGTMPFIVSELLEGMTLRDRLRGGPLPLRRALHIAIQMANGLAVAHEKGIVHRDLKPENVFLTKEGQVKILDFGIAKLAAPDTPADLKTLTTTGIVLGTLTYMSPEQVCGEPVDYRSDIFSVGAVLFEMLTGSAPFTRPSRAETARSILNVDPLETVEPGTVPPAVERILHHCLEKIPADRFQSARDLMFALQGALPESSATQRLIARAAHPVPKRLLLEILLGLLVAAASVIIARRAAPTQPQYIRLTYERGIISAARFAPDQHNIIYSASWAGGPVQLYSTSPEFPSSQPVGYNAALTNISRSGELALITRGRIADHLVVVDGTLARAPSAGGAPRELQNNVRWADWDTSGQLAVVVQDSSGSRLEYPIGKVLYRTPGWISHIRFSPAGHRIGFFDHPIWSDDRGAVCVLDAAGKKIVLSSGWQSADGLAWSPKNTIWVSASKRGIARALYEISNDGQAREVLTVPTGMTLQDIASDGRVLLTSEDERVLITGTDGSGPARDLSWFDWSVARDISADGKWLLFEESGAPAGVHYMVGMRKFDGSPPLKLGEGSPGGLSRDGKWVVATMPDQIMMLPTGAGQPITVAAPGLSNFGTAHILPDGEHIVVIAQENHRPLRSFLVDLHGGKPRPITPEGISSYVVSPDGKSLAARDMDHLLSIYSTDGSPPRRIPNSPSGLVPIAWTADGRSLYADDPSSMPLKVYRVDNATGQQQLVKELMPADPSGLVDIFGPLITPDGKAYAYNTYRVLSTLYLVKGLE